MFAIGFSARLVCIFTTILFEGSAVSYVTKGATSSILCPTPPKTIFPPESLTTVESIGDDMPNSKVLVLAPDVTDSLRYEFQYLNLSYLEDI